MGKTKTEYVCGQCGQTAARWLGRCPGCNAWGSLAEERVAATSIRAAPGRRGEGASRVSFLSEVAPEDARRVSTGLEELDRVLGGGAVAGGVVLIAGDPGIGKSTLLLQALGGMAEQGVTALYVSGEESAAQVALRGRRLTCPGLARLRMLASTDLDETLEAIASESPQAVVVDSIQTLRAAQLESATGSVGQLREVTTRLIEVAKSRGIALFLIGHVTKEGAIAGPKVLEHLVDAVLSFEGDVTLNYRLVRTTKNRFGPAHELGVFEMRERGLVPVADPSRLFLSERPMHAAGSVVVPTAEGQRPLLVEVQALVASAAYGSARRVTTGIDPNRLAMLLAVLERRAGMQVLDQDVFVSVVGGARAPEPAVDLAICAAVASSLRDRPLPPTTTLFGEVGLTGEVRAVPRAGGRLAEARELGFARAIVPEGCLSGLSASDGAGIELVGVRDLGTALRAAFGSG